MCLLLHPLSCTSIATVLFLKPPIQLVRLWFSLPTFFTVLWPDFDTFRTSRPPGVTGERQTNADGGEQDALDNRAENMTTDVQTEQQRAKIIQGLSDEEKDIYWRIVEVVKSQERKGLPPLRNKLLL